MILGAVLTLAVGAQDLPFDTSFGIDGITRTDIGSSRESGSAVLQLTDGRIIQVGSADNSLALVGLTSDGELDYLFGTDGVVLIDVSDAGGGNDDWGMDVIEDGEGRLLVVGRAAPSELPGDPRVLVARLSEWGTLDPTFGQEGVAVFDGGAGHDEGVRVLVDRSGRMVVGVKNHGDFVVLRLLPTGELDPTFGDGGRALLDFGDYEVAFDYTIDPQGRVVGVGFASDQARSTAAVAVARWLDTGVPDPSFGTGGKVVIDLPEARERAFAVVADDSGIVVVGEERDPEGPVDWMNGFALRLTDAGDLDSEFGSQGVARVDFGAFRSSLEGVSSLGDGRYLAFGLRSLGEGSFLSGLVALDAQGRLDPAYGANGVVQVPARIIDALFLEGGGLLATLDVGYVDFAAARFLPPQTTPVGTQRLDASGMTVSAVYPNPLVSSGAIQIGIDMPRYVSVVLRDVRGRKILEVYRGLMGLPRSLAIPVNGLPAGVYWIEVTSGNAMETRPFVRVHP